MLLATLSRKPYAKDSSGLFLNRLLLDSTLEKDNDFTVSVGKKDCSMNVCMPDVCT